jgi:branched-chain amino acid transport system ATP-binding protein
MLALRDVSASYGDANVIEAITLKIEPGEVCAILGANGAGKTSILKAVMGSLPRVEGSITGPHGVALRGRPTHERAQLGVAYVPEGRGILYSLTVRENLLIGATALRRRSASSKDSIATNFEAVLARFPILRERLHQHAGLLSGGQQQMLAIGRALISAPKVLLLDEPSLGLAPLIRREVAETLASIKRQDGIAILLVEQDVKLAERCADYCYILRRGRLVSRIEVAAMSDRESLRAAYLDRIPRQSRNAEIGSRMETPGRTGMTWTS